ncbi:hypothetical protein GQ53DRAFT_698326 [Thozetella sp. PMI_491]|nr:hypothetical protein GQ53DRAFT_698326 [Thozetella sp. PMI_491]
MRSAAALALLLLATADPAWAEESTDTTSAVSLLAQMPACGLQCLVSAIGNSTCEATNTTCVCANEAINTNTTACVALSCSVIDSLVTKNVSNTICRVPVRDRSISYHNTSIVLAVISNFFVVLRIVYKLSIGQSLWWDDYAVMGLIVTGLPSVILNSLGTIKNGLGQDVWTLTPTQITNFGLDFYVMELLYFLQLAILKLTLLLFYLRIFPSVNVKRLLWATVGFTVAWGLFFVLLGAFQCSPVSYYWTKWDGLHQGTCLNVNSIAWANAAISIALDLWMLAIPLWQVKALKIHWKKKIGVCLMFCVGTFVTVVSILRLQALVTFANSQNPTWDNLMVGLWSTIEINVGIFCVCMPALRLLLVRTIPALGSSINSRAYATGSKLHSNPSSQARSHNHSNHPPQGGTGLEGSPKGIMYHQRYSVQYSNETDEDSLVYMHNLDGRGQGTRVSGETPGKTSWV